MDALTLQIKCLTHRVYILTSSNRHQTAHLINKPRNRGGGMIRIGNIAHCDDL